MDWLNILYALLSIGLGLFGWLIPRYTMNALSMMGAEDGMAMSEVRASAGALFVGMGIGALWLGTPEAYVMLGACWIGAAVGRATSLIFDGQSRQKWTFFAVEACVGLQAFLLNI